MVVVFIGALALNASGAGHDERVVSGKSLPSGYRSGALLNFERGLHQSQATRANVNVLQ